VIVIADGSKVGAATPIVVGPATVVGTLVTDPSAPPAELDALRRLGLEVLVAERAAPARLEQVG
jgi:DeoR family transcriptional regulator of aga operon